MSAETSSARYDVAVDPDVPNNSHSFSIQLTGSGKRVLEIGAASGHVTQVLVDRGNEVTAVEVDPSGMDRLHIVTRDAVLTDLDWLDLEDHIKGKFDVIIAGDVLEHLMFPGAVLLMLRDFIKEDGYLIVSLPNVTHADIAIRLLLGEFEYKEVGLLDSTHIRFFDRKRAIDLLESSGWSVDESYGTTAPLGTTEQACDLSLLPPQIIDFLQTRKDSTVYQFVFKARPSDANYAGNDSARREIQKRIKNQNLLIELAASGRREEVLKRELERERRSNEESLEEVAKRRDQVALLSAQLVESKRQLDSLQSQTRLLELEIESRQEELRFKKVSTANMESELLELNRVIRSLHDQIDELTSLAKRREARIGELEAGSHRLRSRLDEALASRYSSA